MPSCPVHLSFDCVILLDFERKINGDGNIRTSRTLLYFKFRDAYQSLPG